MRVAAWDGLLLLGATIVVVAGIGPLVEDHVYGYDEADYRVAARAGFVRNWLDQPSMPFSEFVAEGTHRGQDPAQYHALSERIRGSGDVLLLRHFHGPGYWYALIPATHLLPYRERDVRCTGLVFLLLLAWTTYLGCRWIGLGRVAACSSMAFVVLDPLLHDGFLQLSPHGVYALVTMATLFLAARALQTTRTDLWTAALACLGLALATLEYAVLLAVVLLICAMVARNAGEVRHATWTVARSLAVPALVLAAVWPGAVLKLSVVRSYLLFAYHTLVRPETYRGMGVLDAWWDRLRGAPLVWGPLLGFVIVLGAYRSRERRWAIPFAAYAVLFLATTLLNRSPHPRFLTSFLATLAVLAGAGLEVAVGGRGRSLRVLAASLLIALLGVGWLRAATREAEVAHDPSVADRVVASLRADPPARVVSPQYLMPTLSWYLDGSEVRGYLRVEDLLDLADTWAPDAILCEPSHRAAVEASLKRRTIARKETVAGTNPGQTLEIVRLPPDGDGS